MVLFSPRIIGPLSECSTGVRVQGQLTGSTVQVFANGALVAQGTAFDLTRSLRSSHGPKWPLVTRLLGLGLFARLIGID
jgi:hypothetical protein